MLMICVYCRINATRIACNITIAQTVIIRIVEENDKRSLDSLNDEYRPLNMINIYFIKMVITESSPKNNKYLQKVVSKVKFIF